MLRTDAISRLVGAGLALRVGRAAFQILTVAILVRVLSVEQFGIYAFVIALTQVVAIPIQMGLPQLILRDAVPLAAVGDRAGLRALARWGDRTLLCTSAIGMIVGWAILVAGDRPQVSAPVALLAVTLMPLSALINLRSSQLRGMGVGVRSQLGELLISPLLFLLLTAGVLLARPAFQVGVALVMILRLAGLAVAFLAMHLVLRARIAPDRTGQGSDRVTHEKTRESGRIRTAMVFGISAAIYALNGNLDILMLGYIQGEAQTGIYRVAALAAGVIAMFMQSVNAALAPAITHALGKGETDELQHLIASQMRRVQIVALAVLIGFVAGGKMVLSVAFAPAYGDAYTPLIVLALAGAVNLFLGPAGMLLNLSGNERLALRAGVVSLATNFVLNLAMTPAWGATGAAAATLIATTVWGVQLWWHAQAATKVNSLRWAMFWR